MITEILREVLNAVEKGNEAATIDILDTIYLAVEPNYLDVRGI